MKVRAHRIHTTACRFNVCWPWCFPFIVQYRRSDPRWAKVNWGWWRKQNVSNSFIWLRERDRARLTNHFVCLSLAAPSSKRGWARRWMALSSVKNTKATFSKLQVETINRVSPWSRVSWEWAELASFSRKVSERRLARLLGASSFSCNFFLSLFNNNNNSILICCVAFC